MLGPRRSVLVLASSASRPNGFATTSPQNQCDVLSCLFCVESCAHGSRALLRRRVACSLFTTPVAFLQQLCARFPGQLPFTVRSPLLCCTDRLPCSTLPLLFFFAEKDLLSGDGVSAHIFFYIFEHSSFYSWVLNVHHFLFPVIAGWLPLLKQCCISNLHEEGVNHRLCNC